MGKEQERSLQEERNKIIDILRQGSLFQFDPSIHHKQVIPHATYAPWEADNLFKTLYSAIKEHTLVDEYRCFELWTLTQAIDAMEGDIVEVGVWRGGTGAIFCKASRNPRTKVILADTFAGVVKASVEDTVYRGGEHADTSVQVVTSLLSAINVSNYKILQGIFPDDFLATEKIDCIKLCHIDVDTHLSAKDIFEYAWPRLQVGGIVIFDDYGFWTCEGVTKYFNSLNPVNGRKIHNLNGHGIIIKFQQ